MSPERESRRDRLLVLLDEPLEIGTINKEAPVIGKLHDGKPALLNQRIETAVRHAELRGGFPKIKEPRRFRRHDCSFGSIAVSAFRRLSTHCLTGSVGRSSASRM